MIKSITLFLSFLLAGTAVFAQTGLMKTANKEYANLSYSNAIEIYEKVLRKYPDVTEAKEKLADSYRRIRDSKNAERVYAMVVQVSPKPEHYLYYAQTLAANGKYAESRTQYQKYTEVATADSRGKGFAQSYQNLDAFYADSASYKVFYTSLNSGQADFSPVYYNKGLVFVSGRRQQTGAKRSYAWNQTAFLDLYTIEDTAQIQNVYQVSKSAEATAPRMEFKNFDRPNDDDTKYTANDSPTLGAYDKNFKRDNVIESPNTPVRRLGNDVNTKYHEGPVAFLYDGKDSLLLFTRNNYNKGKYGKSQEGINKLKMYTGTWKNGKLGAAKEVPFNNNDYSVGHPALAPDGKTVYFVSDMPGGAGGTDLYRTTFENGNWSQPENVRALNTEGNEMFPGIDPDGNLYFASDGHPGLGGLDIFVANKKENAFDNPVNIGYPVNTFADDFAMIATKQMQSGYFSSNRRRSVFDDDIYRFQYLPITVNGLVVDQGNDQSLDSATVVLQEVGKAEPIKTIITQKDGKFIFKGKIRPNADYELVTVRKGYVDQKTPFSTKGIPPGGTMQVKVPMPALFALDGTVLSITDKTPVPNDTVTLRNKDTGEEKIFITDGSGKFHFDLQREAAYTVVGRKGKISSNTDSVSTKGLSQSEKFVRDLFVGDDCKQITELQKKYKIENVYYNFDKFNIRKPDARRTVERLLKMLQQSPDMKVELRSHTDSRGSHEYNVTLSENRAKSVMAFLQENGIDASRMSHSFYSEDEPVNRCQDNIPCSEPQHQLNRRTEFHILLNGIDLTAYKGCK
jgi:outer membrane protein OmpA-like peptidoglycan-associated protein/tetratricopeptide (TPR) repeat protein